MQEVQMLIMSAESGLSEYLITGKASTPPKYPWPDSILRREVRVVFLVYPRLKRRIIEGHHSVPLEWKSKFALAACQLARALHEESSLQSFALWDSFRNTYRRLKREPTPPEILRFAGLVDRSLNLP